ncbi:MAG: HK97 gp10 family phage protein [Oscillospiraceae bacterium]|nr:HK97 gp10 family phage protein [Oscillospiraceae bacterium]
MADDLIISITPGELADAIKKAAQSYTDDIKSELDEELERIGKDSLKEIRALSPKLTGKYRRGWTYEIQRERGMIKVVIYNKEYQLVHLLELGHLSKNGTERIAGVPRSHKNTGKVLRNGEKVPPIVHVATVQQRVNERVEELIKKFGG